MKHLLAIVAISALMVGCTNTDYRTTCKNGGTYQKHDFNLVSTRPSSIDTMQDWYTEKCKHCGLEYMFNTNYSCDKHYGSIKVFKSPSSNQFDDWTISYLDDKGEEVFVTISKSDIKYTPEE